jgi:hypothetical protein
MSIELGALAARHIRVLADDYWPKSYLTERGCYTLPQGPGLGVIVDEAVIQKHPQQQIFFNLFAENWHRRQALRSNSTDTAGEK